MSYLSTNERSWLQKVYNEETLINCNKHLNKLANMGFIKSVGRIKGSDDQIYKMTFEGETFMEDSK